MEFELNPEQVQLQDSVRRFVEKQYAFEARRRLVRGPDDRGGGGFDPAHWASFAELGWLAVGLPEAHGGFGGSAVEQAIILEEFGKGLVVEPFLPVAVLATQVLATAGATGAAAGLLADIGTGAALPVLAHGEVDAGGEIAFVETSATPTSTGWSLSGRKSLVLGAPFATHYLVSARTSGAAGDEEGISLFLLQPGDTGLERIDLRLSDSSRASEIVLDGAEVGSDRLILPEGKAFDAIATAHAHATTLLCAEAIGVMDRALWVTRDYLKTRQQFGQPIGNFQALQHRMADMVIELELSRAQVFGALASLNAPAPLRDRAVSSAKVQIGRAAKFIGGNAIQLHGGIGVTEEYVVGHYYKRLVMIDNGFGTVAFHLGRMSKLAATEV